MNYGKLAYQQVSDLAKRVNAAEKSKPELYRSAGFTQAFSGESVPEAESRELILAHAAETSVYFRWAVKGTSYGSGSAKISLLADGTELDGETLSFAGGDCTAERSANLVNSGRQNLSVSVLVKQLSGSYLRLLEISLYAFGAGVSEAEGTVTFSASALREKTCLAVSDGKFLRLSEGGNTFCLLPAPRAFSLSSAESGAWVLAHIDAKKNLYLTAYSAGDGARIVERYLAGGAEDVAIERGGKPGELHLAAVLGKGVYTGKAVFDSGGLLVTPLLPLSATLSRVMRTAFVRGGEREPSLIAEGGAGLWYAVLSKQNFTANGGERLKLSAALE